jgi:heavy metal translocating P-type ATPase
MFRICSYCRGPITHLYSGRPWPNLAGAEYCCYGCLSLGEQSLQQRFSPQTISFQWNAIALRLGIGFLVIGQSMIFGLGISLEEDTPTLVKQIVQGSIFLGNLLVVFLLGGPLFRTAWVELRNRKATIEALFLLTMTGAMIASLQSLVSGQGPIYFEVISVLLVVYTLGKTISAHSRSKAIASTEIWLGSLKQSRQIIGNETRLVETSTLATGDWIEVRPGESIPVDGIIREGIGYISESSMTGEPFPVVHQVGDQVLAGAISVDALFRIEASSSGTARQIDRMMNIVDQVRRQPNSFQTYSDRLGQIFFPLIILVALGTFAYWSQVRDWQSGLFNAMSVLLVACPCALGLATPIVVWSALNRLAERGFVIHSGDVLERLSTVDYAVFDKTGTLTEDRSKVVDIHTDPKHGNPERILAALSRIQQKSSHPIAKAFASVQESSCSDSMEVISIRTVAGSGMEGEIQIDSQIHSFRIGKPEWIGWNPDWSSKLDPEQNHRIDFALNGERVAVAILQEEKRASVDPMVKELHQFGIQVEVLSGDQEDRVKQLGISHFRSRLLPEEKRSRILELIEQGHSPVMIGDGINDASALSAAPVSIALSTGTDLANGVSSVSLYHGDLRVIPWAIALSREVSQVIRKNLFRAASYNLIGITLAATGLLHPIVAVILMVLSSLLVIWSSVRVGIKPHREHCQLLEEKQESPSEIESLISIRNPYWRKSLIHGAAFTLQAIPLIFLMNLSWSWGILLLLTWILGGLGIARFWSRSTRMDHRLDMIVGMLTLGNLGMILGWWADHRFQPLEGNGCCQNLVLHGEFSPWMWMGMLLLGNLAMRFLERPDTVRAPNCRLSMFTGGNIGMFVGMILGGFLFHLVDSRSIAISGFLDLLGMTIGMILGMLVGSELTRWLLGWIIPKRGILAQEPS